MIIYQNNVKGFRDEVDNNQIADVMVAKYKLSFKKSPNPAEVNSWRASLKYMETALRKADTHDECGVLIEYNIPSTMKRVDFIIAGKGDDAGSNIIIIELKQWQEIQFSEVRHLVRTHIGGGLRDTVHPAQQSRSYRNFIENMNEAVEQKSIKILSCAYLHNYKRRQPEPLLDSRYNEIIDDTKIFLQEDGNQLAEYIKKYVGHGKGMDILYDFENGRIRPSQKLMDSVGEMFQGNSHFVLLDEQLVANEAILHYTADNRKKRTIIVTGGPGTGKSVISMNIFGQLLQKEKNVRFVAPNASFRSVMTEYLALSKVSSKKRIDFLFMGSGQFLDAAPNEFEVLVVDEAHRLKGKGAYQYFGANQVEDIIKASTVNVFFVDDTQQIRPTDIGTEKEIARVAKSLGSEVITYKLEAQFRCSGNDGYINWLDNTLQIRETANFDGWENGDFEFKVFDDPNILFDAIKDKHNQGLVARVLAGYAWKWTSEKDGNNDAQVADVTIDKYGFAKAWNSRKTSTLFAVDPNGIDQIGCVHTTQGLEFDYVGVIIGNDLMYDPKTLTFTAQPQNYYDTTGKKGLKDDPAKLTEYLKNIYKILMTRGMKGC
jgi:uncharacterized protein